MKKQSILLLTLILSLIAFFYYFKKEKEHTLVEKVYKLKQYSQTGKLLGIDEFVLRKGLRVYNGKFIRYNEKGIRISEGQFVDNEPNGKSYYFYDNGKLESVHYRKNSEITEESTFYNLNGSIKKYMMFDDFGRSAFIINFNEKVVKKYNGYSILGMGQYILKNKKQYKIKAKHVLKVGDTIKYSYLVANIPNAKRIFKIENIGIDETKVKRSIVKTPPTSIVVEEVLTKKGINTIRAIIQYEFNDKFAPAINDTLSFDVNVN